MQTQIEISCKECGLECPTGEFLFRHIRAHGVQAKDYVLKWNYSGSPPLCACGCGNRTGWNVALRDFTRYIHGHHSVGRECKEETRRKIGAKNSVNMKSFMAKHPDVAKKKIDILRNGRTPEVYQKISKSVREFWSTSPLAPALRQTASERAVRLLAERKIGPGAPYKQEWKRNPWTGQDEWMHSSWESAFLDACIARSYEVHKDHGVTIPYRHPDGTTHTYVPDFYAPEDRTLYEVKGRWDETDLAKWEAAGEWCERRGYRFCLMFEEEPVWAE